jgi:hypothetical protein
MKPPRKKIKLGKIINRRRQVKISDNFIFYKHIYHDFFLQHFTRITKAIKIQSTIRMFLTKKKIRRFLNYLDVMTILILIF